MINADRKRIAVQLQRDAEAIAAAAVQHIRLEGRQGMFSGPVHDMYGNDSGADSPADMMQNSFVRLGSLVALSILADEPDLISDELRWITRLFSVRGYETDDPLWAAQVVSVYAEACEPFINAPDFALLSSTVEAALAHFSSTMQAESHSEDRELHLDQSRP